MNKKYKEEISSTNAEELINKLNKLSTEYKVDLKDIDVYPDYATYDEYNSDSYIVVRFYY